MTRKLLDDPVRQALELSEDPIYRAIREIENNPATRAVRDFENIPAVRMAKMFEQNDIQKMTRAVAAVHSSFDVCIRSPQWAEFSSALHSVQKALGRPETFAAIQGIDANLKRLAIGVNQTFTPLAEQIQDFSFAAASAIRPLQEHFQGIEAWNASLNERIAGIQKPWAIEKHLGVSVVGFARIARLHDISSGTEPFSPVAQEVFTEELGEPIAFDENLSPDSREAAQIDAGMNAEVVAFPRDAYPHVLLSAGFEFRFEAIAPIKTDGGESGLYDPQHTILLAEIENRLRAVIETELQQAEGMLWLKRRVHGDIRSKWQHRKTADHDERGDSFPVFYYADFMELMDIICDGKNWKLFERFFVSKQDFQVSMQRLKPVRNAIGHNRPLVRTDQLILLTEGTRILRALGVHM